MPGFREDFKDFDISNMSDKEIDLLKSKLAFDKWLKMNNFYEEFYWFGDSSERDLINSLYESYRINQEERTISVKWFKKGKLEG